MPNKKALTWVAGHRTPTKTYITRVFNFGTWDEWKKMKSRYTEREIRKAITHPLRGQWTPRGKALAECLYQQKMPKNVLISYDA